VLEGVSDGRMHKEDKEIEDIAADHRRAVCYRQHPPEAWHSQRKMIISGLRPSNGLRTAFERLRGALPTL